MTKLVGILNLTPDSFSDGGDYVDAQKAVAHAQQMIADGASVIDVGAESTRPNATKLTHDEEWIRLETVLQALLSFPSPLANINCSPPPPAGLSPSPPAIGGGEKGESSANIHKKEPCQPSTVNCKPSTVNRKLDISVDTYHPETANKALKMGVNYINDVSGFTNKLMIDAVKNSNAKLIIMHNMGVPADKNITIPVDQNAVEIVYNFAENKINELIKNGIARDRIIFDIGLGFGKTAGQSIDLIKNIDRFKSLNVPLYVGHSRKSFLKSMFNSDKNFSDYDRETAQITRFLVSKDIDYLRVHNIPLNILELNDK